MLLMLLVACVECEEYDPGPGCDLVQICCNDATDECEYRSRYDISYECAGGELNCRKATEDMLCAVCGDTMRSALGCPGADPLITEPTQSHP